MMIKKLGILIFCMLSVVFGMMRAYTHEKVSQASKIHVYMKNVLGDQVQILAALLDEEAVISEDFWEILTDKASCGDVTICIAIAAALPLYVCCTCLYRCCVCCDSLYDRFVQEK
ncbi:MAG: hypothetical protein V1855_05175 [bacterium]